MVVHVVLAVSREDYSNESIAMIFDSHEKAQQWVEVDGIEFNHLYTFRIIAYDVY